MSCWESMGGCGGGALGGGLCCSMGSWGGVHQDLCLTVSPAPDLSPQEVWLGAGPLPLHPFGPGAKPLPPEGAEGGRGKQHPLLLLHSDPSILGTGGHRLWVILGCWGGAMGHWGCWEALWGSGV